MFVQSPISVVNVTSQKVRKKMKKSRTTIPECAISIMHETA